MPRLCRSGACGQGRARTEVLLVSTSVGTALSFPSSRIVKPSDTETGCSESIREAGRLGHLSERPLRPSYQQRCGCSLDQSIPQSCPKHRNERCFLIESENILPPPLYIRQPPSFPPTSLPAPSILVYSEWEPTESRAGSWEAGHTAHSSFRLPQFAFPAGLRLHPTNPQLSLMKEQWCKIRWGEKQEVEPESSAAEALTQRRLWQPPATRGLTGKW